MRNSRRKIKSPHAKNHPLKNQPLKNHPLKNQRLKNQQLKNLSLKSSLKEPLTRKKRRAGTPMASRKWKTIRAPVWAVMSRHF